MENCTSRVTNRTLDFGGICLVWPPEQTPDDHQNKTRTCNDETPPYLHLVLMREHRKATQGVNPGLDLPPQREPGHWRTNWTLLDPRRWPFPACSLSLSLFPTGLSLQIKSVLSSQYLVSFAPSFAQRTFTSNHSNIFSLYCQKLKKGVAKIYFQMSYTQYASHQCISELESLQTIYKQTERRE